MGFGIWTARLRKLCWLNQRCLISFGVWLERSRKMFFESTTTQLGFGLCERAQAHKVLSEADVLRKRAAIQALVQKPMKVPRKLKTDPSVASGSTPLLDMEQAERHRWAARLEAIGRRAGNWAKLFESKSDDQELTPTETAKLRQLVLTSGAHRTMSAHVRVWERWELWAASVGGVPLPPFARQGAQVLPLARSA